MNTKKRLEPLYPPIDYGPLGFRISLETTVITEPLDPEGYPDFDAAIRARMGSDIDPRENLVVALLKWIEPTFENQSIEPIFFRLLQMDPKPQKGMGLISFADFLHQDRSLSSEKREELIDKQWQSASKGPWRPETYPRIAEWLKIQEFALAQIQKASHLPGFYFPRFNGLDGHYEPLGFKRPPDLTLLIDFLDPLITRSWMKAGLGDWVGGRIDLITAHRILRKMKPSKMADYSDLINWDCGQTIQEIHFLAQNPLTAKERMAWQEDLESLPGFPECADFLNWADRYEIIRNILQEKREARKSSLQTESPEFPFRIPTLELFTDALKHDGLDWNTSLLEANRGMDLVIAAHRDPDLKRRKKTLFFLSHRGHGFPQKPIEGLEVFADPSLPVGDPRQHWGKYLAQSALWTMARGNFGIQERLDEREEYQRILEIMLALAHFHQDQNRYPDHLEDLAPICLKEVPLDLFSGQAHRYQKIGGDINLPAWGPVPWISRATGWLRRVRRNLPLLLAGHLPRLRREPHPNPRDPTENTDSQAVTGAKTLPFQAKRVQYLPFPPQKLILPARYRTSRESPAPSSKVDIPDRNHS